MGVGVGGWMWVVGGGCEGGLGGGGEEGRAPARPTKTVAKTRNPPSVSATISSWIWDPPPYPVAAVAAEATIGYGGGSQIELDMVAETLVASPILIDLGIDGDGLSSLFNYQPRFLG